MPRTAFASLTVPEAARVLGCASQTVRRLLQKGRLPGRKHGREWIVWLWADTDGAHRGIPSAPRTMPTTTPAALRQRLRSVGAALITIGNQTAGTHPQRGTGVSHLAHAAQPPGDPGDWACASPPGVGAACAGHSPAILGAGTPPLAPGTATAAAV
jgi:excisionase family DNA binding protein